jgi:hypothetical protein
LYDFTTERPLDLKWAPRTARQMSDQALKQFGAAARYMSSAKANAGKRPREVFVVQLEEAIAECHRRHSVNPMVTS